LIEPVAKMPDAILKYAQHPYVTADHDGKKAAVEPNHLFDILALLKTRLKCDFHYYKKSTLVRRIRRRMGIVHVVDLEGYLKILRNRPKELNNLFKDILIGVTQFFRDPQVFDDLEKKVIPRILKNLQPEQTIRVWVPGCSSGEEAYSIAMLFIEAISKKSLEVNVQVFATDIDANALDKGRSGLYPENISADISEKRLQRFFIKDSGQYRVSKPLRECVAFAEQNLISDPPFSKLDLVSCRNLLIYIEPELQKKIITLFHYTLNEQGYLLLGTSETIGRLGGHFKLDSKQTRIYQRLKLVSRREVDFPIIPTDVAPPQKPKMNIVSPDRIVFAELTHKMLSESYAPASVLINRVGDVLFTFGTVDRFLKLPSGEFEMNIAAMAREGLKTKLRTLFNKAIRSGKSVSQKNIPVIRGGKQEQTTITVSPVREPKGAGDFFLVVFDEEKSPPVLPVILNDEVFNDSDVNELEKELQATREDLQSTIEEMETSNEELKAANEEAMSMNEELQSTNEELETSKEELQSLNEELSTVNAELQDKLDQLEASRNDISNLLSSTDIATLFLDEDLKIKRYTPAIIPLLNVRPTDIDRPLSDLTRNFSDPRLVADAGKVLTKLIPIEREIINDSDNCFIRRILPYRTEDNRIEGVVITFVDVTHIKKTENQLRLTEERFRVALNSSPLGIVVAQTDAKLRYTWVHNPLSGFLADNPIGKRDDEIAKNRGSIQLKNLKRKVVASGKGHQEEISFPVSNGFHVYKISAEPLFSEDGKISGVTTSSVDITDLKVNEERLIKAKEELENRVEERTQALTEANELLRKTRDHAESANATKTNFLAAMSHELRTPLNGILGYSEAILTEQLGLSCNLECQPQMGHINNASNHLHDLINDILDISAVEVGKLELYEEKVEIPNIINSSIRLVGPLAKENDQTIRQSIAEDLPKLFVDERRLKQILVNLLSNAVKFSGKGQVVSFGARVNKKGELVFRVADKGIGMSKDEVALAVEPFSQVDSFHTRKVEGTGLGLPIAREFTEAHGGTLTVQSKPKEGTVVTVTLPAERLG